MVRPHMTESKAIYGKLSFDALLAFFTHSSLHCSWRRAKIKCLTQFLHLREIEVKLLSSFSNVNHSLQIRNSNIIFFEFSLFLREIDSILFPSFQTKYSTELVFQQMFDVNINAVRGSLKCHSKFKCTECARIFDGFNFNCCLRKRFIRDIAHTDTHSALSFSFFPFSFPSSRCQSHRSALLSTIFDFLAFSVCYSFRCKWLLTFFIIHSTFLYIFFPLLSF